MERFQTFFLNFNILTKEQFNELSKLATFSVSKKDDGIINLIIEFESLPKPELYFDFVKKIEHYNNDVVFILNHENCIFDYETIIDYLIFYTNENKIFSNTIVNILERKSGKIQDNKLIINYLNFSEEKELHNVIELFNNYLKRLGINLAGIELFFDEKSREIELYKDKKLKVDPKIINYSNINNLPEAKKIYRQKKVNITGKAEKINDIIPEQQSAIILVEIFSIKQITTKNQKLITTFYVTDYSNSMILKYFSWSSSSMNDIIASLKVGDCIKCRVDIQIDNFERNEIVGVIREVVVENKKIIQEEVDDAFVKRVEFLAHSNMSAFEGIDKFDTIAKKAIEFDHCAIGLTDKFNCQSFPSASIVQARNKDKLNIMYGFQSNILDQQVLGVINERSEDLQSGNYVIFDIETTGLYPLVDDIIEFGAIKYENRQVVDKIQFFIKPKKEISSKITEITRITNEMVEDGIDIVAALEKIVDFCQGHILIAHNGINFDINFLNFKLAKYKMKPLTNPLIDTMVISRSINEFKSNTLGSICAKFKIEYSDITAHRADFDAQVLLKVWTIFIEKLNSLEIFNLNEINSKILNNNLISKTRPWLANFHALNEQGIKEIYQLISQSLTTNLKNYPFLWIKDFQNRKNLLFSNSPTEGDVWESALYQTDEQLLNKIEKYDVIFVAPPSSFAHEIQRKNITISDLQKAIKRIYKIASKANKKVLASSEFYYINKNDAVVFDIYVHTKAIGGKPHRLYSYNDDNSVMPEAYFKTTNHLLDEFAFLGKEIAFEIVVENTNKLAQEFARNICPIKTKLQTPIIEGADENLKKLAFENLYKIYGPNPDQFLLERLNRELSSVIDNGYGMIYWFSHLLVKMSTDDGYLVGSRGSIGSSFAALLVGISDVNPLPPYYLCPSCKNFRFVKNVNSGFDLENINCEKCQAIMIGDGHNIPFEVFMGFDGDKVPDIDLNFSAAYQAKAHQFIKDTFGKKHVFRAGTIGTVAEKTAFGYVKGYFEAIGKNNVSLAEVNRLAQKCCNVKRTTGQHPGGIIVVPLENDVFDFTPYNYPADDPSQDWYTTHYAFESLHDALLKFDILGHDSPTVLKMLAETTGKDPSQIPNHDDDVMAMFNSIESLNIKPEDIFNSKVASFGIPEFGTRFVREMLEVTKPKNFSDLVRISGLSHGTNVWNNNARDLITNHNIDISEVISCRDDIMVYLQERNVEPLTAFKIMEDVRKGKGLNQDFIEAMKKANIKDWYIESCQKIKYLFPKAHATAYVNMAWKIAWYKKYYPLHFYASYLSIRISVFDPEAIYKGKDYIKKKYEEINNLLKSNSTKHLVKTKEIDLMTIYEILIEMIERGYKFKMVDLLKSHESDFIIGNDYLIPPFSIIPGLGSAAAKSIVEERKKSKFTSRNDLLKRTKINKTVLQMFADYGMLDELPESEQLKLF